VDGNDAETSPSSRYSARVGRHVGSEPMRPTLKLIRDK
jgi:hypothetical protein